MSIDKPSLVCSTNGDSIFFCRLVHVHFVEFFKVHIFWKRPPKFENSQFCLTFLCKFRTLIRNCQRIRLSCLKLLYLRYLLRWKVSTYEVSMILKNCACRVDYFGSEDYLTLIIIVLLSSHVNITLGKSRRIYTGQNTFPILLLNYDKMLREHKGRKKNIVYRSLF